MSDDRRDDERFGDEFGDERPDRGRDEELSGSGGPMDERFDESEPADEQLEGAEPEGAPSDDRELDSGLETDETSGLGLTEEFARIEAEIEEDATASDDQASGDGEPALGRDDPQPAEGGPPERSIEETVRIEGPDEDGGSEGEPERVADDPDEEPPAEPVADGPGASPPQPVPVGVADSGDSATEHPVVAPGPERRRSTTLGGEIVPELPEEELHVKTPKLWLRFLAGSVLIMASIATAVAVTGLLFLSDVAAKLQPIPGIQQQLDEVDPGAPQTILIIGSDRRADTDKTDRRSDTTMLLRVDPEKKVLSLFSLPRDLKVDIPGYGVAKLNEAYTVGGEKKTLKTVKRFTGLDINHVVEINFSGFADAVNAIDCVYVDVDREYFNDNSTAASIEDQYAEIDINAGYQRLCGLKALQYVRYRHTDNDLVRAARQQDFLREARQKVEPRELAGAVLGFGTGNELVDIFTEYTRSDIDDEDDVIGILKSFAAVRDVPVNEVHFEGDIGGPDDPFVTSTDKQVEQAIDTFLNGAGSSGQRGGEKSNEKKGGGGKRKSKKKAKSKIKGAAVVPTGNLADAKFPTLAERFEADAKKNARRLGIPAFYPTEVVPGSAFSTDSRTYEYKNEENKKESAYKTVITLTQPTTLVEYYGVMGTTWEDPPILRNPSETRTIDGREYLLFYDGGRLRLVGWREQGNSYWLNNTLTQSIGEPEMLAMAASMREVE